MFQNLLNPKQKMSISNAKLHWLVTTTTMPQLWLLSAFGLVPRSDPGLTSTRTAIEEIALSKVPAFETALELN